MYRKGDGMPQNYGKAYVWFSVVASSGDDRGRTYRDDVATELSPEALIKAQDMATEIFERIQKKMKKK